MLIPTAAAERAQVIETLNFPDGLNGPEVECVPVPAPTDPTSEFPRVTGEPPSRATPNFNVASKYAILFPAPNLAPRAPRRQGRAKGPAGKKGKSLGI